jgi:hypothetical protein
MRIHLAGKHALELEMFHCMAELRGIGLDVRDGAAVGLFGRHLEQFAGIAQAVRQLVQAADHLLELGAFLAELLRTIRVVPDAGLFELADYFLQPLVLVVVIKDTSSKSRYAPRDL